MREFSLVDDHDEQVGFFYFILTLFYQNIFD